MAAVCSGTRRHRGDTLLLEPSHDRPRAVLEGDVFFCDELECVGAFSTDIVDACEGWAEAAAGLSEDPLSVFFDAWGGEYGSRWNHPRSNIHRSSRDTV